MSIYDEIDIIRNNAAIQIFEKLCKYDSEALPIDFQSVGITLHSIIGTNNSDQILSILKNISLSPEYNLDYTHFISESFGQYDVVVADSNGNKDKNIFPCRGRSAFANFLSAVHKRKCCNGYQGCLLCESPAEYFAGRRDLQGEGSGKKDWGWKTNCRIRTRSHNKIKYQPDAVSAFRWQRRSDTGKHLPSGPRENKAERCG